MMKSSLRSALAFSLALGCSPSGDALFNPDGLPSDVPAAGGTGGGAAGGGSGAAMEPGAAGEVSGGGSSASGGKGGSGGASVAGKPADEGEGGDITDPGDGGEGPGAGGAPEEPPVPDKPVCGNGKIEAGEQCDDGGAAGQDGCEACKVVCSHFGQGALTSADYHCYVGFDEADFAGAVADCTKRGAHLVTITNAEENALVRKLVNTSKLIGGFEDVAANEKGTGTYGWVTGEAMSYQNWADTEPNRKEYRCGGGISLPGPGGSNDRCYEHCLGMNGQGRWEDRRCDEPDGYVCEWVPAGL